MMKRMITKSFLFFLIGLLLLPTILPAVALADAMPGDVIVTLGEDLSESQRQQLMNEMGVTEDNLIVYVSNEEEHQYLGSYISASRIGTNALSSSKITLLESGEGLSVETNRIDWISDEMYMNALITAGVEDAEIYVTAPIDVSGTAALTGLLKAYEVAMEIEIPEEQKQIANEEMVKTGELSHTIGAENATELMNRIKEEIGDQPIESEEDLRALIQRIANEMGITLTDEELNGLISLFMRMKDLNIDWNQVQNQINKVRDNLGDYLNREETQSFIRSVLDFFSRLIDVIKGWFS
ncbi:extracellular protein [Halalkalibacter hemicellulosilyticusJCM 9152]|uniref:Extracellular protein n=2 Tax=Halalkalibacter TaxID=2893056 RepID=W4QF28_9BACI|nr:extracellular protein [Halalkalibacter hemicellulosilyticusJCM 9152]